MPDRARAIDDFLAAHGWAGAGRTPLAGDASFRRYVRLAAGDGRRAVLMDAPSPHEDVRPYLHVAELLRAHGYSAPAILAADADAGLVLLEDLGDDTFTRVLERAAADEPALYALAVDLLIDLHRRPADDVARGLPPYDDARLIEEAALLVDWTWPRLRGAPISDALRREYVDTWTALFATARRVPDTLVLRDYHVDNLMRLDARAGLSACGLLDFQDAVRGPVTYDLVSLLEDARRDVPGPLVEEMKSRYLAAFPRLDSRAFEASYAILGAQRNAKIIGIFTRLAVRDSKPAYLEHIPRVWRLLARDLAHPALAPMKAWMDAHIPAAERRVPPCPSAA